MLLQVEKDTITEFSGTKPICQAMHNTILTNSYFPLLNLKKDGTDRPLF
jgi:hypothetical protein